MATHSAATPALPAYSPPAPPPPRPAWRGRLLAAVVLLAVLALLIWGAVRGVRSLVPATAAEVPTATVKRGTVVLTVNAKGVLQGGNSEMLTAPMAGGGDLHITSMKAAGDPVKPGDIVVQFDATDETYKLKQAEADLAEAEQQVIKARAQSAAQQEQDAYALIKAKDDLQLAALDVKRNPLLSTIEAHENDLAHAAARDHLTQLQHDLQSRQATNQASIAIQEAARHKAQIEADRARKNIALLSPVAKTTGYVAIQPNTNLNFFFTGMTLQPFQVGDAVRAGMAVVQIPDLKNLTVNAEISELDRGHLAPGQPVQINVVALPGKTFHGHVANLGGSSGPPWRRSFVCSVAIDDPTPELRPGTSADLRITTETLPNVLWVPAQAVFESDSRSYVYIPSGGGFVPHDVKILRRSESQVVISGVQEGQVIALASPEQKSTTPKAGGNTSALQGMGR
ncbi:MAG: efflux RND transporter periplasmic adaptor subunit [Terriglobales bacterium]